MKSMVPGMQVPQYAKEEFKSRRVIELKTEIVRKDTGLHSANAVVRAGALVRASLLFRYIIGVMMMMMMMMMMK